MLISSQTQRKLYTGRWQQYDKDQLWELSDVLVVERRKRPSDEGTVSETW